MTTTLFGDFSKSGGLDHSLKVSYYGRYPYRRSVTTVRIVDTFWE